MINKILCKIDELLMFFCHFFFLNSVIVTCTLRNHKGFRYSQSDQRSKRRGHDLKIKDGKKENQKAKRKSSNIIKKGQDGQ